MTHRVMKSAEERSLAEAADDDARWARFALTGEVVSHDSAKVWLEALARGETSPWPS